MIAGMHAEEWPVAAESSLAAEAKYSKQKQKATREQPSKQLRTERHLPGPHWTCTMAPSYGTRVKIRVWQGYWITISHDNIS
jgi:hypothetical protein